MTSRLAAICFDAHEPGRMAEFWAGVLGWEVGGSEDPVSVVATDGASYELRFRPTDEPKRVQNLMHFDLPSPTSQAQQETVDRVLAGGGRHLDVGQLPDEDHVVMADPEGNELCVIEPGNGFLAGTGVVGALSCDGSRAVGLFWSAALGWPLVWDQDEETAVQSPLGGTKVSWGGPPYQPRDGRVRVRLELVADGDRDVEADRLSSLGATRLADRPETDAIVMADPDGNEFWLES